MVESRTKNSLRNYGTTVITQIAGIILSFIGRTFFIKFLSIDYLGVNGLFSNILSLLSLAELGVGTAITYMMYKPIADNNIAKVAAYNNLFRKVYNCIGLFIIVVGLSLTPFIDYLIKEPPEINENLHIVYVLFVLNTAVSYFFTYKRSLLIAYQKEYVNSQNVMLFAMIKDIVLIGLLYCFRDYYIYMVTQIIITLASNASISYKTNRLFPEIVNLKVESVPIDEIKVIVKNTAAMVCHKIGSVVVSGTGNLFISCYVGIAIVGVYSNYVLMYTCANQIIGKGVNSLTASFGNLVATSDKNDVYVVFKKIFFLNFILAYLVAVCFYILIDPFITLWIGNEYLLDSHSILLIIINSIFFFQLRVPSQMAINTYGLFWQIKWKSLVEALINLCCSFFFTAYLGLGIVGILMASLVSNVSTSLWWEPYVAYKYGLKQPIKEYSIMFVKVLLVFILTIVTLSLVGHFLNTYISNVIGLGCARMLLALPLSVLIIWMFYHRSFEYKYALSMVYRILKIKS